MYQNGDSREVTYLKGVMKRGKKGVHPLKLEDRALIFPQELT
jgi:hypothetical protein